MYENVAADSKPGRYYLPSRDTDSRKESADDERVGAKYGYFVRTKFVVCGYVCRRGRSVFDEYVSLHVSRSTRNARRGQLSSGPAAKPRIRDGNCDWRGSGDGFYAITWRTACVFIPITLPLASRPPLSVTRAFFTAMQIRRDSRKGGSFGRASLQLRRLSAIKPRGRLGRTRPYCLADDGDAREKKFAWIKQISGGI